MSEDSNNWSFRSRQEKNYSLMNQFNKIFSRFHIMFANFSIDFPKLPTLNFKSFFLKSTWETIEPIKAKKKLSSIVDSFVLDDSENFSSSGIERNLTLTLTIEKSLLRAAKGWKIMAKLRLRSPFLRRCARLKVTLTFCTHVSHLSPSSAWFHRKNLR